MFRLCLPLMTLIVVSGCAAKLTVTHLVPSRNHSAEGVFYALPKTVVRPVVKVDKTSKKPARYSRFAGIFSPSVTTACNTIPECRATTESHAYSVQQGATFSTFGEPDPEHVYMVQMGTDWAVDQTMSLAWTETGVVSSASASVTNRSTDIALAGLKMASSLGTKLVFGATTAGAPARRACDLDNAEDKWVLPILQGAANPGIADALITNYCNIGEDDRTDYDQTLDESLLKEALAAFMGRVVPLLIARNSMLTGGGGANIFDRAALIAKQTEAIDAELNELFAGASRKSTWEATFEVRNVSLNSPQGLLGLTPLGVCVGDLLAYDSKPLPSNFNQAKIDCRTPATTVTARFAFFPDASQQLFNTVRARSPEPAGERSFRYRIPAQVRGRVVVETDKKSVVDHGVAVFSVAQHGIVRSLPASNSSKQISFDLAFIESTGGLKSFKVGQTGLLDAATIDALSATGGTVLDAGNAAAKRTRDSQEKAAAAAAEAADELTILTREAELLKLKKQICDIQKEFGIACTVQQ
jgi:hypothetical protein